MKYIYYYIFSTFFPNFFLIFFFAKFDGFIMLIACPLDFRFAYRYLSAMRRQNFYFTAGQVICRLSRNIDRGQSDRGDRWKHQHNDGWMSDKCEKFNFNFNFSFQDCQAAHSASAESEGFGFGQHYWDVAMSTPTKLPIRDVSSPCLTVY